MSPWLAMGNLRAAGSTRAAQLATCALCDRSCPNVPRTCGERAADVVAAHSQIGADAQVAGQWVCVCAQSRDLPRLIVPSLACVLARLFPSVSMVIFRPYPTEKADQHERNDRRTNGIP